MNMDITIMLPAGKTMANIDWLSVWCDQFSANFGHVYIPDGAVPPVYVPPTQAEMPYYGTTVGAFDTTMTTHDVSGTHNQSGQVLFYKVSMRGKGGDGGSEGVLWIDGEQESLK